MFKRLLIVVLAFQTLPQLANACGPETDCRIGDRHYQVQMPEGYQNGDKVGAIVFAHGFGGSATAILKNKNLKAIASELGVAIIATKSAAKDWSIPGAPSPVTIEGVDELAYFDTVIKDATRRFPIDPDRLMMTGFSAGGMMVWNLACFRSHLFAAFAPMAGTFWQPEPASCDTPPTNIMHIHGDADKTVPLKGRKVLDTHQGDVSGVLDMYRSYGGYVQMDATEIGPLACETSRNDEGQILNFCLFQGGHSFSSEFVRIAWTTFAAAGKL